MQQREQKSPLDHTAATMTSAHITATIFLNNIVAFGIIVAFIIPLVALLTSSSVMWCEEHLQNFSVLQRD
jgi:hypothetical protein